ncbi:MAG: nucleoside hydrolase [Pirellulales bacterium]|nr:nucleoside hydrolase [Pirellulales bacterium]
MSPTRFAHRRCLQSFAAAVWLCFFMPAVAAARGPIDIWLDVDPSIGLPRGEVDDGLALIQAFHSPELRIHGVSVVFGNTSLEKGYPIAQKLVADYGPQGLQVFPGAAKAEQLGEETPAVTALAKALTERPLTILAVGPVTNVASLVQLYPQLRERITAIVVVAGRREGQRFEVNHVRLRDANFEHDVEGMQALLDTQVPLVYAPWEVSSQVWLTRDDFAALGKQSAAGRYLAEATQTWLDLWEQVFKAQGCNPFDTLAVGWLTHPELIDAEQLSTRIVEGPDDRAAANTPPDKVPNKSFLIVEPPRGDARRVTYCFRPHPEFKGLLLERLAGPPQK